MHFKLDEKADPRWRQPLEMHTSPYKQMNCAHEINCILVVIFNARAKARPHM